MTPNPATTDYGTLLATAAIDPGSRPFCLAGDLYYQPGELQTDLDSFCRWLIRQFDRSQPFPLVYEHSHSGQILTGVITADWRFALYVRDANPVH